MKSGLGAKRLDSSSHDLDPQKKKKKTFIIHFHLSFQLIARPYNRVKLCLLPPRIASTFILIWAKDQTNKSNFYFKSSEQGF